MRGLLSGFDYRKFQTLRYVLQFVRASELDPEDGEWLARIEGAWLNGEHEPKQIKGRRCFLSAEERRLVIKGRPTVKEGSALWAGELAWNDEQELKDEDRLKTIEMRMEMENLEAQRKLPHDAAGATINCRIPLHEQDGESYCDADAKAAEERAREAETEEDRSERELDAEWEREWHLERQGQFLRWRDERKDGTVIETGCTKWVTTRALRPVYGVVIGVDMDVMMLVVAVTDTMLVHVCDFSFSSEDTIMLENNRDAGLALKTAPLATSLCLDRTLVDVDIEGYKYLHYVEENRGLVLVGVVAKIETYEVIVALTEAIHGRLRFDIPTEGCGFEVGMQVDVMITDFNPVTNDINLELNEDEELRTLLVEG